LTLGRAILSLNIIVFSFHKKKIRALIHGKNILTTINIIYINYYFVKVDKKLLAIVVYFYKSCKLQEAIETNSKNQ